MGDPNEMQSFGVFFGNLEDEVSEMEIAALIISLIFRMTGIQVQKSDVRIRHSNNSWCYTANVNLHDPVLQQRTVRTLQQLSNNHIPMGLVKKGRALRVDYFQPYKLQGAPMSLPSKNQTTTGQTCLMINQQMGNETRSLEFKRGQGNLFQKYMKKLLSRYVCGFLNSEGGQLMLGVDDEGFVQGVQCDHKTEDNFRIMFDQLIHLFDPPVLPPMYRLEFIPVRDERGVKTNLKVVSIDVKAGHTDTLYETPEGEVYIRRDGSVQGPLRAKDVQAWCHLKISQGAQDKEKLLKNQIEILELRLQNIEMSQGQGGQAEQPLVKPVHRDSLGGSLSPAASPTAVSSVAAPSTATSSTAASSTAPSSTAASSTAPSSTATSSTAPSSTAASSVAASSVAASSTATSSTAVSSQDESKNSLKRTNSKLCFIL